MFYRKERRERKGAAGAVESNDGEKMEEKGWPQKGAKGAKKKAAGTGENRTELVINPAVEVGPRGRAVFAAKIAPVRLRRFDKLKALRLSNGQRTQRGGGADECRA